MVNFNKAQQRKFINQLARNVVNEAIRLAIRDRGEVNEVDGIYLRKKFAEASEY